MMHKRWIVIVLAVAMLLGLAACGNDSGADILPTDAPISTPPGTTQAPEVYTITIWVPVGNVELTQKQIEQFNTDHAGQYRFEATVIEERAAVNKLRHKSAPAPDLFFFTTEEELDFVTTYGLSVPLSEEMAQIVGKEHHANAVAAASRGGRMYAYPVSFVPANVMFYDKSVISEADTGSLEALIAACEASGRNFSFAQPTHSFFSATGCVSDWTFNEEEGFVSVYDTYNSPEGLIALEHLRNLSQSACYKDINDVGEFEEKIPSAVVICLPQYAYDMAKQILGDNLGVAQLPSFEHEGKSYQLMAESYGYMLGISPQEDGRRLEALQILAQYLAGDTCQLQRYEECGLLPSNLQAQQAVARENPHWETVWGQPCMARTLRGGEWWQCTGELQYNVRDGMPLERALSHYAWSVESFFRVYTWTVIGSFEHSWWGLDIYMEEQPNGTYRTQWALYFEENTEFKIRFERSWTIYYGADGQQHGESIKPGVTGYYYVVFDPATGLCQLEPQ